MKKLKNTNQIPDGATLRIYFPGFGYSKLTVIDITEQFIGALAEDDFFEAISDGDQIECYFWVEHDASYEFTAKVIGRISRGRHILFLDHSKKIQRREERSCLSAAVSLPFRYFLFHSGFNGKSYHSEDLVYQDGTIVTLSDREMSFTATDKITDKSFVYGHLDIPGHRIELVGKIILIDNENYAHALLSGIQEKDRTHLLDYIFTVYRE